MQGRKKRSDMAWEVRLFGLVAAVVGTWVLQSGFVGPGIWRLVIALVELAAVLPVFWLWDRRISRAWGERYTYWQRYVKMPKELRDRMPTAGSTLYHQAGKDYAMVVVPRTWKGTVPAVVLMVLSAALVVIPTRYAPIEAEYIAFFLAGIFGFLLGMYVFTRVHFDFVYVGMDAVV